MVKAGPGMPRWNDKSLRAGTMVRTALWLISEIGIGNTFTKEQHRQAFVGIAQADRRLRDLRTHGWIIHTSQEDVSLNSNEQRLVKIGGHVWEPTGRSKSGRHDVSAKERMAILAEGNYQCAVCGIAGGETYPDDPFATAVLSISKKQKDLTQEDGHGSYFVECKLCKAGKRKSHDDIPGLLQKLEGLSREEQDALVLFAASDPSSLLLSSWSIFCRLSDGGKAEIKRVFLERRGGVAVGSRRMTD